jgi:hypothetical protein
LEALVRQIEEDPDAVQRHPGTLVDTLAPGAAANVMRDND